MFVDMKRILLLLWLVALGLSAAAQDRYLVRVGAGDSLFESLVFHPADETAHYTYSGHWFADFHYKLTRVVSVGGQLDWQSICWDRSDGPRLKNYDLSILPTVRFTWLDRKWVRLYSSLGAGLLVAWDNDGGREAAPVFNLNGIGIQFGDGPWCGSADLGFMVSLKNVNHIYLMGARILSVGVNYRW